MPNTFEFLGGLFYGHELAALFVAFVEVFVSGIDQSTSPPFNEQKV
jgi:hypothetical protein